MSEVKNIVKRFLSLILIFALVAAMLPAVSMPVNAADGEVTGLSNANIGLSYSGDKTDTWSATGTTITGSIQSSSGCGTTHYSSTLTITNKRNNAATLSFKYEIDQQGGTIKVDGTAVTADGPFSKELRAGETATVYIKSNSTSAPTKITISNIALVKDGKPTVTFVPAENGSYMVDGETVNIEYSTSKNSTEAYELKATADAGYQFKGWRNVSTGKYINSDKEYSFMTEEDCTLIADFVEEGIGLYEAGNMVYENLDDACKYAKDNGISKITLLNDATINGTHIIPEGVTLLIPFDKEKTLFKETPTAVSGGPVAEKKSEFRRLTLSSGASLIVEGGLSVGGQYRSAAGASSGYMSGAYGQIMLEENSNITVKENGALYAWGFISGDGSVVAESGSTVHEWYQIMDFRGGTATMGMGNKVFPFSQYSVQNIESSLTLEQGASEIVYAAVYANRTINYSSIEFIGDEGLFKIAGGSLNKRYDGTTDRMVYTINGAAELSNLNLSLAGISVSSKNYVLPVTNNMTINISEGSTLTVNQDTALLAGTVTNIAQDAGLIINSTVYVYDR